tara:strand:+ start:1107 stop:1421 length:315 start_codon:yes stop_codon:yes gene_type:complete
MNPIERITTTTTTTKENTMNVTMTADELRLVRQALHDQSNVHHRLKHERRHSGNATAEAAHDFVCRSYDELLDKLPTPVDEIVLGDPHEAAALTEEYLIEKSDR